jgi:hypothetical protein
MSDFKEKFASDPMPGRAVRVTVPVSVAFNLEKMQTITKTVLGKLGCGACCSGFDLRFIHENDFRFNEKGELLQH